MESVLAKPIVDGSVVTGSVILMFIAAVSTVARSLIQG